MFPVVPKPASQKIGEMVTAYYCEQAKTYDKLDKSLSNRNSYIQKINEVTANRLRELNAIDEVVHIACGTGRRAVNIRNSTASSYKILGVDISANMCEVAAEKDIDLINSGWVDVELAQDRQIRAED